jgi:hypothetical protein
LVFSYSRYADDITVSAVSRGVVEKFISSASSYLLTNYGLQLNDRKTRIASRYGRQAVTGVVVNENASPPREKLRKIRVIFHQASIRPKNFTNRTAELAGHIGYINQFPKLRGSQKTKGYSAVLLDVREASRRDRKKKVAIKNAK